MADLVERRLVAASDQLRWRAVRHQRQRKLAERGHRGVLERRVLKPCARELFTQVGRRHLRDHVGVPPTRRLHSRRHHHRADVVAQRPPEPDVSAVADVVVATQLQARHAGRLLGDHGELDAFAWVVARRVAGAEVYAGGAGACVRCGKGSRRGMCVMQRRCSVWPGGIGVSTSGSTSLTGTQAL